MAVDLHTHSCCSDGSLTPSELMELAYEKKLSAIALTDHDTVSGIKEAKKAAEDLSMTLKKLYLLYLVYTHGVRLSGQ